MQLINEHIVISDNAIEYLANFVNSRDFEGVYVLADENTNIHCVPLLKGFDFEVILIPSGEQHKTLATCEVIFDALIEKEANRKSLLINVSGGVGGDMGGFCASVFQRGLYFINVPTTLLSMVDASIGGKLGVDYKGLKNYIGLFKEPLGIFIHPPFLETLSDREVKAGYAEMLKHGLIHDAIHWGELQEFNPRRFKNQITTSVAIKDDIVEQDMHENGLRKLLNFGHTVGHAVESWFLTNGKEPLLHGEAVALGMLCEAFISQKMGLDESELNSIVACITKLYALPKIEEGTMPAIIKLMHADKKNTHIGINFTLLKRIGEAQIDCYCTEDEIREAIMWYNQVGLATA
jgi:3-dehydroquinate synthase